MREQMNKSKRIVAATVLAAFAVGGVASVLTGLNGWYWLVGMWLAMAWGAGFAWLALSPDPEREPEPYWYLAAPMDGQPGHGIPALADAADCLRAAGETVWNPGEHPIAGVDPDRDYLAAMRLYMAVDLPMVAGSQGVIVLPGWEHSTGCRLEVWTALQLGLPVIRYGGGRLAGTVTPADAAEALWPQLRELEREARQYRALRGEHADDLLALAQQSHCHGVAEWAAGGES